MDENGSFLELIGGGSAFGPPINCSVGDSDLLP